MTSQEQAKAIVETYNCNPLNQSIADTRSNDWLIHHFAQALDAARRETWAAAAKMTEKQFVYRTDDELSWSAIDKDDLLEELRQQAAAQADKEAR